jgi:hemoglobin-like flavoprotein
MACITIETPEIAGLGRSCPSTASGADRRRLESGRHEPAITVSPAQISLLHRSLPAVLARADRAARAFRENFLRIDPAPRPFFASTDIFGQGARLIDAIASGVHALRAHGGAATALRRYHVAYGARDHHFRSAGIALARALEQELGSDYTAELGEAYASASQWVGQAVLGPSSPMAA